MSVALNRLQGIGHIELRVRKLEESARFYCELFGLAQGASPPIGRVCVCRSLPASGGGRFSIVLTQGLPDGTELAGLDHVGLTVPTEQDVRDTYARALDLGFRATRPRRNEHGLQTYVFDPDGYKIEVASGVTEACGITTPVPRG